MERHQRYLRLQNTHLVFDYYLIANGAEILERCKIRGFVIVSNDKDYLPVMQRAISIFYQSQKDYLELRQFANNANETNRGDSQFYYRKVPRFL